MTVPTVGQNILVADNHCGKTRELETGVGVFDAWHRARVYPLPERSCAFPLRCLPLVLGTVWSSASQDPVSGK